MIQYFMRRKSRGSKQILYFASGESVYFFIVSCMRRIPLRITSDLVVFNCCAQSSNTATVSLSIRTRIIVSFGLSVGRPIFADDIFLTSTYVATLA